MSGAKRRKFVWLYTSTISRFGERFRDGQYSLVSFLLAVLLLTWPRAQSFVMWGHERPISYGVIEPLAAAISCRRFLSAAP